MTDTQPEAAKAAESEGAERSSKKSKRAGTAIAAGLAAAFLASAAVPGAIGTPARGLLDIATEGPAMIYTTQKDDIFYIDRAKMHYDAAAKAWTIDATIIPDDGTHPGAMRFIVEESVMHNAWSRKEKHTSFDPPKIVSAIAQGEGRYAVTYHSLPFAFLKAAKPPEAELLDVKPSPEPPKTARSGIPFAWPPGMWDRAFSPF
jgi:hypothetical protein